MVVEGPESYFKRKSGRPKGEPGREAVFVRKAVFSLGKDSASWKRGGRFWKGS